MTAPARGRAGDRQGGRGPARYRERFRAWRRQRPFWGGLLAVLAGAELLAIPFAMGKAPVGITIQTLGGVSSLLAGVLLILMGLVLWFQPQLNVVAGVVTLLVALVSFPTSNFGGFLLGMLLGIVGGALGFAWRAQRVPAPARPAPDRESDEAATPLRDLLGGTATEPDSGDDPGGKLRAAVALPLALVLALGTAAPAGDEWRWPGEWRWPWEEAPAEPGSDPTTPPTPTPGPGTPTTPGGRTPPPPGPSGPPSPPGPPDPARTPGPPSTPRPPAVAPPQDPNAACTLTQADLTGNPVTLGSAAAKALAEALAPCLAKPADPQPAESAPGVPPLAAEPSVLTATSLTMVGLRFDGVVTVPTARRTTRVLKFRMDRLVAGNLEQRADDGGRRLTVGSRPGDSELSGGIQLYVTRMTGKAFGILPVEFTPAAPPPLTPPFVIFTDVTAVSAYTRAGSLTLPRLRETVTQG